MVNAYDGFPYERIDAAHRYLQMLKPWWGNFGTKLKIVPVYQAPGLDEPYGAVMSTDMGMRLYIDRSFAVRAPLHELAGQLEHEYRHHTNDTWNRLRWLDEESWARYFTICVDLEINSDIEHEATRFSMDVVRALANRSAVFTTSDLTRWQVSAPPSLPSFAWTPSALGLPERLSAEEYYALLKKADDEREREEQQDEEPEEPEEPEGLEDLEDEESEDSDAGEGEEGTEDEPLSDEQHEDGTPDSDGGSESTEGSDQGSDLEDEAVEDQPEDGTQAERSQEEDSPSESGDASTDPEDDDTQEGSASEEQGSDDETGESQDDQGATESGADKEDPSDAQDDGQGDEPQEDSAQPEVQDSSTEDIDPSRAEDVQRDEAPIDAQAVELGKRFEELLADPMRQIAASEMANPADPLTQQHWMPEEEDNAAPTDVSEVEKALEQLAEDIELLREEWATDRMGPQLSQWADKVNNVRRIKWEARFSRLFNAAASSVKLKGQSDLSYSTRNPNQPRKGVVLMGLSSYAPSIVVLQDVSASMLSNQRMAHSQEVFTQLTRAVVGRFQAQVTWMSADTELRDVGKTSRWSRDLATRLNQGYGATDFGHIIEKLMVGDLRWKGRKIAKPDLLVVCTDAEFFWPEQRPSYASKLLVVCVGQQNSKRSDTSLKDWMRWDARDYLPSWLKPTEVVFTELGMSLGSPAIERAAK